MTEVAGKAAVVTGGGSGIGMGLAKELAREGASVAVADILSDNARKVAGEINDAGGNAVAIHCDVSDRSSIEDMKAEANAALGTVELVFANAGATSFMPVTELTESELDWMTEVNLKGVVWTTLAFLPDMIEAGSGHVTATASMAGLIPTLVPVHSAYSGSKMGVIGFMRSMQLEVEAHNVVCTIYCPGGVLNGMRDNNAKYRPERFGGPSDERMEIPKASFKDNRLRFYTPEEVAPIVLRAVRNDRPFVFDHSEQRQSFREQYADVIEACFDDIEQWEQENGLSRRSVTSRCTSTGGNPQARIRPDPGRRSTMSDPTVDSPCAPRGSSTSTSARCPEGVVVVDRRRASSPAVTRRTHGAGAGADQVIDLPDLTLVPGLMDMEVDLVLGGPGAGLSDPVRMDPVKMGLRAVANGQRTLRAGFTTVRNLGLFIKTGGYMVDVALADAIAAGWVQGPRVIPAGHAICPTGGHLDPSAQSGLAPGIMPMTVEEGIADGIDEVRKAVRYQITHGAKLIKCCASGGVMTPTGPPGAQQYSTEELAAIADEAHRRGLRVATHCHGDVAFNAAIDAGIDCVEHGMMIGDDTIQRMVDTGTFLVSTCALTENWDISDQPKALQAKAAEVFPKAKESLSNAIEAGVKVALGTGTPAIWHGRNAEELEVLVRRGMTPIQAIRSATTVAADLIDRPELGQIAPEMLADIIGVHGDPLTDIATFQRVPFVMKDGDVFKHRTGTR